MGGRGCAKLVSGDEAGPESEGITQRVKSPALGWAAASRTSSGWPSPWVVLPCNHVLCPSKELIFSRFSLLCWRWKLPLRKRRSDREKKISLIQLHASDCQNQLAFHTPALGDCCLPALGAAPLPTGRQGSEAGAFWEHPLGCGPD